MAPCVDADNLSRVSGGDECLAIRTYQSTGPARVLVVFVHGDVSSGGPADYLYAQAQQYARQGVTTVAMLRPGYFDSEGNQSSGTNYNRTDSYTNANIGAVAAAIQTLKRHHHVSRVVYLGHSGGAAYGGVILGKFPGVIDAALLLGCPCNIPQWRAEKNASPWLRSRSPHEFIAQLPQNSIVVAINGSDDVNTFPHLAKDYVAALQLRGVDASYVEVPGAVHDFTAATRDSAQFVGSFNALIDGTLAIARTPDYQDVWWGGASENGWGLSVVQHGNTLAGGWYVFGADSQPTYLIMEGGTWNTDFTTFTGPLVQPVSGAPFSKYDPASYVAGPAAGTASLTFTDADHATLNYTVKGVTGAKAISRLQFGSEGATPGYTDRSWGGGNYADVWWGGAGENGWGIALAQQGSTLVGSWYTFGIDGKPVWFILNGGVWTSAAIYTGDLIAATGAPVLGAAYNASAFVPRTAGGLTLKFNDANNATMTYTVDGVTQSKSISRLAF